MIPLRTTVLRSLARAGVNNSTRVLAGRFQSTAAAAATTTAEASPKPEEIVQDLPKKQERKRYPVNRKLRDIIKQIRSTAESSDLAESTEVLEEGLSYLREIQVVEGITEESFYFQFQSVATIILNKALEASAEAGEKTAEDILNLLIEYKVAHEYHFTKYIVHELSSVNDTNSAQVFGRVLSMWVKNLEFSKGLSHSFNSRYTAAMREENFQSIHMINLVYFAYVMSCLKQNISYSSADARKILQRDGALPTFYQVRSCLRNYGLLPNLNREYEEFAFTLEKFNIEEMDPNGVYVMTKLKEATTHNDWSQLNKTYQQAVESSAKNSIPIKQQTVANFMNAYHSLYRFDDVFRLFQDVLATGNAPSEPIWDVVIRTMGHPTYVARFNPGQRGDLLKNVEATVSAFLQQGNTVNAKMLAVIVGAYANLNRQDKVQEFLATYKDVPIAHTTKNNVIIGLLFNNDVDQAEATFNEYTANNSSYVPSTTVMNSFLSVYSKKKNYRAIEGITEYMKKNKIHEDVATYSILVDSYFNLYREKGIAPNVNDLLSLVIKDEKFFTREHSVSALIKGMINGGNSMEGAREIFETLSKKNKMIRYSPVILTLMIRGELDHGSHPNAEVLFHTYITKVSNTPRIWNTMILGLLKKNEELSLKYYNDLKQQQAVKKGVKANIYTYYFLLDHFVKRNNLEKIQYFINELDAANLSELGQQLPQMLQRLSRDYIVPPSLLLKI